MLSFLYLDVGCKTERLEEPQGALADDLPVPVSQFFRFSDVIPRLVAGCHRHDNRLPGCPSPVSYTEVGPPYRPRGGFQAKRLGRITVFLVIRRGKLVVVNRRGIDRR